MPSWFFLSRNSLNWVPVLQINETNQNGMLLNSCQRTVCGLNGTGHGEQGVILYGLPARCRQTKRLRLKFPFFGQSRENFLRIGTSSVRFTEPSADVQENVPSLCALPAGRQVCLERAPLSDVLLCAMLYALCGFFQKDERVVR